jgi:predicted amidophosphoribosyltransferase
VGTYFEHGNSPVNGDILSTHIWHLKFGSYEYAKPLATAMAIAAKSMYHRLAHCDMIVPVPPFEQKSYDHADQLGEVIAGFLELPLKRLLSKTRGEKMVEKATVEERWKAIEGLYVMVGRESESNNKTICLVDDICTSGATLSGCSRALSSQGKAKEVYALVAGRRFDERCPVK